jgi:hypothetical protein
MQDLTTELQNFALSCEGHAREASREAESARAEPRAGTFPEYDRRLDLKARGYDQEAALWGRRAAEARKGRLLADPEDITFPMGCYGQLYNDCVAARRVTWIEPLGDPHQPLA